MKKEKNKKISKHLLLKFIMLLLVYCCNIEIKLLHIVILVLQCIEDIVDSSKHFF